MGMVDHTGKPARSDRRSVNGFRMHFREAGSGPALVMLHGVPKTSYHWRFILPLLSSKFTVIMPDLRGLGDSDHPHGGYDSVSMSDDVAALMRQLGHTKYVVVGEDWGAVIGYHVAARNPDSVTALIFAEALFPGFGFEDHTALTAQNAKGLFLWHLGFYFQPDVPEMLISGHERALITYMIKSERLNVDSATPDALEEYGRCYSMPGGIRAMLAIYRAMLEDAAQNREAANREKLHIPVLALGGSAFIAERNGEQIGHFANHVETIVFEAGHDLAEEVPQDMAVAILRFLDGLEKER